MPELDWRDVRVSALSLADLLDFDTLMSGLSHDQQRIVNRKIAHEVSESEPARKLSDVEEDLESEVRMREKAEADSEQLADEVKDLKAEREDLQSENARLEKEIAEADINIANLRRELTEAEARHGREMQEAEVRGYQRGRSEVAA